MLYFVRIGAGGVHIVLPAYYAPASIGMVDMSTSDGRFLFFIPWEGHVLVGKPHEISTYQSNKYQSLEL